MSICQASHGFNLPESEVEMSFGRKMEGWGWLKIVSHRIVRIGLSVTLCHWMFLGTGRVTVSTDILVATEREA